jgi:hypothetical protein
MSGSKGTDSHAFQPASLDVRANFLPIFKLLQDMRALQKGYQEIQEAKQECKKKLEEIIAGLPPARK